MSDYTSKLLDTSGIPKLSGYKVAIIATEWNDQIVAEQIAGAERVAKELGVYISHKYFVPGSVEIPFAARRLFETQQEEIMMPDAIITFGAVIRGETPHFDYVCKMLTDGIHILNMSLPIPVIFGVLTTENEEQVWDRLGGKSGHKGEEAMITAAKMIAYNKTLEENIPSAGMDKTEQE